MTDSPAYESSAGRMRLVPLTQLRDSPLWRSSLDHLAKDHRYYEIVAGTLDFDCRALVLEDDAGVPCALMPSFFVEQDLAATAPVFLRHLLEWWRQRFPRALRLRMLMLGCAAGEGPLAGSQPEQQDALLAALLETLPEIAVAHGASLIVWKDVPSFFREALAPLRIKFLRVPSMPATRLAIEFGSFEEYLAGLSHATRKDLRRKFKAVAEVPLTMTVATDVAGVVNEVHALYLQVFERSPLRFEKLTREFLLELGERMPDRVRFFLWRREDQLVAVSICFVHEGVLYDEYLGLDYRAALDLHLYFVTFRDVLSWAIAQGLRGYRSTPLNYDPKLHLAFRLAPLDLYVAPAAGWLRPLLRLALPWISPTRGEFVLSRFPNAEELDPP